MSPTAWPPPSRCRQAPPRTTAMSTDTDASTAPTCVIAEDEEILRSALESLLREAWPELSIVASCDDGGSAVRSEEHTSELQSLLRTSYAVFCLKKKNKKTQT